MNPRLPATLSSVVLPQGFAAAGIHCGLKKHGALDLGLLLADMPTPVAALFTKNALTGAHIAVCRDHLKRSDGLARAILVNSRNANCATGEQGIADARLCCEELAQRIGCPIEQVLMVSTGPIGAPLPKHKIIAHLDALLTAASPLGGMNFAHAIMTTDTYAKAASATFDERADGARITGFAKGSGMIHPDMATMLGFLLTDAVAGNHLHEDLGQLADRSFHRTTVDGDTSPNDSLFLLASGRRGQESPD